MFEACNTMEDRYEKSFRSSSPLESMLSFAANEDDVSKALAKDGIRVLYSAKNTGGDHNKETYRILQQGDQFYFISSGGNSFEARSIAACIRYGFAFGFYSESEYNSLLRRKW